MSKRFFFLTITILFIGSLFTSCSEDNSYNPYEEQNKGFFNPTNIVIRKNTDSREITEKWTNITRNHDNKVTSYEYSFETNGDIIQKEYHKSNIKYYQRHDGENAIETNTDISYSKNVNGITEDYTRKVHEIVYLNENGYIKEISSIIDHIDTKSGEQYTTTSTRTFAYSGDFCKSSTYRDMDYEITYNYKWNGYQLTKITEHKKYIKDGSTDYSTYEYQFNTKYIFPYKGTDLMAFVQSGMPQIYASMGYVGKGTPYILTEEEQGGRTEIPGHGSSSKPIISNSYSFDGDISTKLSYIAFSNIYNTYSITFSK